MSRAFTVVAIAVALIAVAAPARAQTIVLESYPGQRPPDADYLLDPLLDELELRGFAVGTGTVGRRLVERMSESGRRLSLEDARRARGLVDEGWNSWIGGDFQAAIDRLRRALELFRSAPATIARDQSLRDPMRRALVGLALSHRRLNHAAEATGAMAEVLRSFPDRGIDKSTFGPEAKDFYNQVKADLQQQGLGALRIDVDDPNAVVFVNERYVTLGSTRLDELYPGRYRIYLQRGDEIGRVYEVDVPAGGERALSITWGLDSSLRSHDFVGFEFDSAEARRSHEARYATTIARAIGASGVAVVGIAVVEGKRVLEGAVLLMDTATPLRRAYLPIEPVAPNATQIRSLARFLSGEDATGDIVVDVGAGGRTGQPAVDDSPSRFGVWKWLALGTGAAAAGAGLYLIAIDGSCSSGETTAGACAEFYETMGPGIGLTAAGAVLVGTGIALWIADEPAQERLQRSAGFVPTRGGVIFGVSGTF